MEKSIEDWIEKLKGLSTDDKIEIINKIKLALHNISPFKDEPVDCVLWVKNDSVQANDYNPNKVAKPEMDLLKQSILADGYTQPIVACLEKDKFVVVDGFHRNRVGKELPEVKQRVLGYLPITLIRQSQDDRGDRIASTIRHNRARGKHIVEGMSEIVVELKRRNWSDARIGKELGMEQDEILRLTQISGLADMFKDEKFSEAWNHVGKQEEDVSDESMADDGLNELEWIDKLSKASHNKGWNDRTELSSVLYGDNNIELGRIQKSRFKDEWFYYAYLKPLKDGRSTTKESAKKIVEELCQEKM